MFTAPSAELSFVLDLSSILNDPGGISDVDPIKVLDLGDPSGIHQQGDTGQVGWKGAGGLEPHQGLSAGDGKGHAADAGQVDLEGP